MKELIMPDGFKVKQFAIGNGFNGRPFFAFLSEGGKLYVEDPQGWPPLGNLHEVEKMPEATTHGRE